MQRQCARPSCHDSAHATFAYDYAARTVWLDDLAPSANPSHYDLCEHHAAVLTAPLQWEVVDRRAAMLAWVESWR